MKFFLIRIYANPSYHYDPLNIIDPLRAYHLFTIRYPEYKRPLNNSLFYFGVPIQLYPFKNISSKYQKYRLLNEELLIHIDHDSRLVYKRKRRERDYKRSTTWNY